MHRGASNGSGSEIGPPASEPNRPRGAGDDGTLQEGPGVLPPQGLPRPGAYSLVLVIHQAERWVDLGVEKSTD